MRVKTLTLTVAAGLFAAFAIPVLVSAAPEDKVKLDAKLSGKQEVPEGSGDEDGKGTADLTLNSKKKKICFEITFRDIDNPTAAHIHKGLKGVDGQIKVTLFEDSAGVTSPVEDCVKAEAKQIDKITKNPERFYVNVHNGAFEDGAIRGQLSPAPE
jgi:hypothetical protein